MGYLWFLFILACPIIMFFMMRGMMGGGHDMGADDQVRRRDRQPLRAEIGSDQRILDLERQVAELRAERYRNEGDARR
jgi:hypothetical protein